MDPVNPTPAADEPTPLRPEPGPHQPPPGPPPSAALPPMGYWQLVPPPRRRGCLFYFSLAFALVLLAGLALMVTAPLLALVEVGRTAAQGFAKGETSPAGLRESYLPGAGSPECLRKIAVIEIKGIILSRSGRGFAGASQVVAEIEQAREDEDVVAVLLDLNTPGGEVTASDEIHQAVLRCRQRKPVVACMRSFAASGGYYVAAGCDWIVANRHTLTGSIGVIVSSLNYANLMATLGLKLETIKSGEMKDAMSGARAATEAEREHMRALVLHTFHEFADVVAAGRERYPDRDAVLAADFADGRILTGTAAHEAGLVDELGYFRDAVAKAQQLAGDGDVKLIGYRHRSSLGELLLGGEAAEATPAALVPPEVRAMQAGCLFAIWPRALVGGAE